MTVRPHSGHVGQLTTWFYTFVKSKKLVLAFSFSIHLSFSHSRQNARLQTQDRPVVATRAVKAGADGEGVRDGSCRGGGTRSGALLHHPGSRSVSERDRRGKECKNRSPCAVQTLSLSGCCRQSPESNQCVCSSCVGSQPPC